MSDTDLDPLAPSTVRRYSKQFYLDAPDWDKYGMEQLLTFDAGRMEIQFRTAAQQFRYVDDAESQAVLVWWDDSRTLIGKLSKDGPERWLMRKLQRYAVNLPKTVVARLTASDEIREVWPGIYAQNVDTLYHVHRGLDPENNNEPLVI